MAEFSSEALTNAQLQPPDGEFAIKKLYVKDVSFESPNSPFIFTTQWEPNMELQLHTEAVKFASADFEVTLMGTVTVTSDSETLYLAEVTVAGVFLITGLTQEEMGPVLGSYCPAILFPYLREAVADLSVRGGFPQLVLAPVNFDALYYEHLSESTSEAESKPAQS